MSSRRLRLRSRDRALLGGVLALFAAAFALHGSAALGGRLRWSPVWVAAAPSPNGFPTLIGARSGGRELPSELAPGDELLAIGDTSLQGKGVLGFLAVLHASPGDESAVRLRARRGGEARTLALHFPPVPLPWRTALFSVAFVALGALAFWRTRGFGPARLFLLFSFFYGLHWAYFWGGPAPQVYAGMACFGLGVGIALPLALRAAFTFPLDSARAGWPSRVWPWCFLLVGAGATTWAFGYPLPPPWGVPLAAGGSAAFAVALLAVLTQSFRRAGATGRRQIKWVLAGLYLGLVPPLVLGVTAAFEPRVSLLYELSLLSVLCIPIGLFIALARDHLYDVDRLISASASYTLLSVVAISALLVAVPQIAAAASRVLDPRVTTASLAVSAAILVVLLRARVEPWVQRTLFRERAALERGAQELRQELTKAEKPSELLALLGERLTRLLRPMCTAIYGLGESGLEPVFVRGPAAAPSLDASGALGAVVSTLGAPLRIPRRRRDPFWRQLAASESAALEAMGAAVLAPIRHKGALSAFLCLGEKQSGDIYTETDLALIGSVVDKASDELERFEERSLYEAEREMNSRLRQYVPGAVAEEIESGEPTRASQREVTVLFVDVRGYTALVEGRRPHEIFEIVSAYTRAVSAAVADASGTIVEFNGDGMMAVFGAPRAVPDKEAAAIRAARAIRAGVATLSLPNRSASGERLEVGIGIATGPAYVGSIQSADRAIWTALGNTTNLASRLQTMTREQAAAIALDELTRQRAGREAQGFHSIGIVPIRGRTDPIEVYVLSNQEGRR